MPAHYKRLSIRTACVVLFMSLLAGCATGRDPRDPFESMNRGIYQFNEGLDKAILKPVAQGYRAVLPQFVRSSVSNFFSNINDILVALNNLLQGKFTTAFSDFGRIAINSTLGIGGLFDVASEAGIEKHDEDFGQTLGWWGFSDGPFIVLPFFGPSNMRDTVGRVVDYFTDPITYVRPRPVRYGLWGTRIVNRRAELLDASTILEAAALDPYEFVRDAYAQRRRNLIYDGEPPRELEMIEQPDSKPRTGRSRDRTYSAAADTASEGMLLASAEPSLPLQPAMQPVSTPSSPAPKLADPVANTEQAPPAPVATVRRVEAASPQPVVVSAPPPPQLDALQQAELYLPASSKSRRTARAAALSSPEL